MKYRWLELNHPISLCSEQLVIFPLHPERWWSMVLLAHTGLLNHYRTFLFACDTGVWSSVADGVCACGLNTAPYAQGLGSSNHVHAVFSFLHEDYCWRHFWPLSEIMLHFILTARPHCLCTVYDLAAVYNHRTSFVHQCHSMVSCLSNHDTSLS